MGRPVPKFQEPEDWMVPGAPAWFYPVAGGAEREPVKLRSEPFLRNHTPGWGVLITGHDGYVSIEGIEPRAFDLSDDEIRELVDVLDDETGDALSDKLALDAAVEAVRRFFTERGR